MISLRELRRSRSLTFLDLAHLTGVPARLLAEAECGIRHLSPQQSQLVASSLGLADATMFVQASPRVSQQATMPPYHPVYRVLMLTVITSLLIITLLNAPPLAQFAFSPTAFVPAHQAKAAIVHTATRLPPQQEIQPTASMALVDPALLEQAKANPDTDTGLALIPTSVPFTYAAEPATPTPSPLPTPSPTSSLFAMTSMGPQGCPLQPQAGRVVLTQGYGTGTHAPAEIWGAVDLAVDGNGDGWADPQATQSTPVVATNGGVARVSRDSWPAGNNIWVEDWSSGWSTGYSHLEEVFVESGAWIAPGQVIGTIGSTGMSSGPHLDYQVWQGGVNMDPTALVGVCQS